MPARVARVAGITTTTVALDIKCPVFHPMALMVVPVPVVRMGQVEVPSGIYCNQGTLLPTGITAAMDIMEVVEEAVAVVWAVFRDVTAMAAAAVAVAAADSWVHSGQVVPGVVDPLQYGVLVPRLM